MIIPVCVFAKPPVAGTVKTRLAPALNPIESAALASAMLVDIWQVVLSCERVRPVLAAAAKGNFPIAVPDGSHWLQGDGDLGERIERILRRGLEQAPAAIAIGADSPLLTPAHLGSAITALKDSDAVIGPCLDGGFYLLGLRECPPGLLVNIPWSSRKTASAVIDRITRRGSRLAQLESLCDVDTPEDLARLVGSTNGSLARETHAFLSRHRARQTR